MSFNYAREKRKFDKEWEQLQKEYAAAGMDEAAIAEIKEFDWKWFCSRRVYDIHNQPLPGEGDCSEKNMALFSKFPKLTMEFEQQRFSDPNAWKQEIENAVLYQKLDTLKGKDLELITLIVDVGYRQADIARMWGCSRSSIAKRWKK